MIELTDTVQHKFAFLRNQKAPSAIFIGNRMSMDNGGIRKVSNYDYESILQTVEQLRKHNIDAVPVFSEQAENPSKTVVTAGGIQTPVLKPNKLEKAAKQIFDALDSQKITDEYKGTYRGYSEQDLTTCSPVEFSLLAPAAETSQNIYGKNFEAGLTHPNTDEFIKLREQYGFDLEYDLVSKIDINDTLTLEQLQNSNQFSIKSLYRGGCLGDTPYICFASRENKMFAYATPEINCAKMYSGLGIGYGVNLCATSSKGEETIEYGLIYEFEASPMTRLYGDWQIEQGNQPYISAPSKDIETSEWNGKQLETVITPSQNKLKNIYVHIRKDNNDVFYPIPLKDKRWQAFLALHRSSDTCLRGHMIERRKNVLKSREVFSSLNSRKKFGIFEIKVKPKDFRVLNAENAVKEANLTVEEKRAQKEHGNIQNMSHRENIVTRINELRCSKVKNISINSPNKPKILQETTLQMIDKNKKTGSYS